MSESKSLLKQRNAPLQHSLVTTPYDLYYLRLEWSVDPAVRYINGKVTSRFKVKNPSNPLIEFELSSALKVDSIFYKNKKTSFSHQNDLIKIDCPNMSGDESVTIYYQGVPTSTGFGSFDVTTHAGTPVMYTLSEPYGSKDWWPSKEDLADKIDSVDIIITTPSQYRAGSNGLLVEEKINSNNTTSYHWKHRYPITSYLIALSVTNYQVSTDEYVFRSGKKMNIVNYIYPENFAEYSVKARNTLSLIQLYDSLFIDYPFKNEKYGHCQWNWGGGEEHQTMTYLVNFDFELVAHELAHQWFGDYTTCGSWTDIWLNEGFATYVAGLAYEAQPGKQYWRPYIQICINASTSAVDGSTFVTDTTSVGRIFSGRLTYRKGAMILHMLRWKLGDKVFFSAVRNYLTSPAHKYGYARTWHLKHFLEEESGEDLTEFFEDWFYGEGYPTYHLTMNKTGQNTIQFIAKQTTSHPSVDFYEMPIQIKFKNATRDTTIRLDHNFSGQSWNFNLGFDATAFEFDPNLWLISKDNSLVTATTDQESVSWSAKLLNFDSNKLPSVEILSNKIEQVTIHMIDLNGRKLMSSMYNVAVGKNIWQMPLLNQIPPGSMYFYLIESKNIRYSLPFYWAEK